MLLLIRALCSCLLYIRLASSTIHIANAVLSYRGDSLTHQPRDHSSRSGDRLARLFPIGEETGNALFRQDMVEQRLDDGGRHGGHVSADLRCLQHMDRMTDRGHQDFRGEVIIVVDQADVFNKLHAIRSEEHTSELQSLMR